MVVGLALFSSLRRMSLQDELVVKVDLDLISS